MHSRLSLLITNIFCKLIQIHLYILTNTIAGTRGEWQAVCRWRQVETLLPVPPVPSTLSPLVLSALLQSKPCHAKRWTRGELLWQIHFHLVTNTIWSQMKIYPFALFSAKLFNSSESQVICCWGSVSVSQLAWLISSDCEDWQSVFICFGSIRSSLYSH